MSESIRRKSSSRQVLQNLISLTAQRSQEDAEEVERERRRRARETQRGEESLSWPEAPQHNTEGSDPGTDIRNNYLEMDEELKPRCCLVLEEDEGFSDWSHRLENRTEPELQQDCGAREQRPSTRQRKPKPEEEKQLEGEQVEEERCEAERSRRSQEAPTRPTEKMSSNRKEVRTSYSSTVFVSPDTRLQHAAGQPADRTSYLVAGTMKPRGRACRVDGEVGQQEQKERREEEMQAALQREWRSAGTRQNFRDEDDQEEEELSFMHEEKEDLHLRREQRHGEEGDLHLRREQRHREEGDLHLRREQRHGEEGDLHLRKEQRHREEGDLHLRREQRHGEEEEEHKMPDKRSAEGRRSEEVNRRSAASVCSSSEGDESVNYGPMSPTFKKLLVQFYPDEVNSKVSNKYTIIERTESLKKSTSSIKKTQPPVPVSKIDKKLEQYTHALEAGEAWNQNATPVSPSKDADGLKVGVADLINQWVRGSEDGSRCSSPSRPADMKAGGVLNKKNLWESIGDTLSPRREGKESSTGKRYKFVVAGHGKYEKVSVDDDGSEETNCQSAGQFYEDL